METLGWGKRRAQAAALPLCPVVCLPLDSGLDLTGSTSVLQAVMLYPVTAEMCIKDTGTVVKRKEKKEKTSK